MKKVFLLLTSALMGVAAFAGNTWEQDGDQIDILYNSYGTQDANGVAIQWQAGNKAILGSTVEDATGNTAWSPALGEQFMVTLSGTASMTGKLQAFIVDEREEAGWWAPLSDATPETNVTAGEAFNLEGVFTINNITLKQNGDEVEGGLTAPGLVFGFLYDGTSEDEGFDATTPLTITVASFEVLYAEAVNYEDPIIMSYNGTDKNGAFQFQATQASAVTAAKAGQYANVEISGVAASDITTLMYALVDNSEGAGWWKQMSDDMVSFAANLAKGDKVDAKFSFALTNDTPSEAPVFKDVLLANAETKGMSAVIEKFSIKVTVTDQALYDEAKLAVEEVANVTIENGVVYSAGAIVVYNVAGQVVATASQEFSINSLNAGVYFVATAEGTAKIVK